MRGTLLAPAFLERGIAEMPLWAEVSEDAVAAFRARLATILGAIPAGARWNEAETEQEVVEPILAALGWSSYLPQQTAATSGRADVPDYLLFSTAEEKKTAAGETSPARFRLARGVLEAKRWGRALDRRGGDDDGATPSTQMLRYLTRAEVLSDGQVRLGILTNGRHWRVYWQRARSRSEDFLELDLAGLCPIPGLPADPDSPEAVDPEHYAKVFLTLFGPAAFLPVAADVEGRNAVELAAARSREWEAQVSAALGAVVFDRVFPGLLRGLAAHDPARPSAVAAPYLDQVRREGLTLLYRFLFVAFAEDRGLLPARDRRYDDYSLHHIRREIAARVDVDDAFSATASHYYTHARDLFAVLAHGDPSIGVPAYDGGLFDLAATPLLERSRIPDAELAPLLDLVSRREEGGERRWINYRDLSVQQLGSIYERLLEFDVVADAAGGLGIRPNPFARRGSGSFYTHDDLVTLVVERTVGPLVEERRAAFSAKAAELATTRRSKAERLEELYSVDAAARILDLSVCDPAMGSGHFLVALVDFVADQVLEATAQAESEVRWVAYRSPLLDRLERTRCHIVENAAAQGWEVKPEQLEDRALVRRMVLKRVVFGVDRNPMAVELAKVALWLHTFTVGAPLSFLDHHLQCGDSLFGEWLDDVDRDLRSHGALFLGRLLAALDAASSTMRAIADLDDADVAEVHGSRELHDLARATLAPLRRLLDFWQARRWLDGGREHPGVKPLLSGAYGDLLDLLEHQEVDASPTDAAATAIRDLLARAREVEAAEPFLHWELAFPGVWRQTGASRPGFDAVIGNPPWDRMKLQEVEWFAARRPEIAGSARAADRKSMIGRLEQDEDPLWQEYRRAAKHAETAARVARTCGQYPMLSRGDVNLYSLFVERADRVVAEDGMVGLLVPSGIAADLSAADFFGGVATSGRLAALLDFENKKAFFPDVDSRFKFSALVFGGAARTFQAGECAFFLHAVSELDDPERSFTLTPGDLAAVNPNTRTAPVFRARRDAVLTTAAYARLPVLVDRRGKKPRSVWPVRYSTMFHMTNDSGLFKRRDELEALGYYPVAGNRWKRGQDEYLPLYEGKMVQAYDHRAASVVIHPENLHRPGQPEAATLLEHRDPRWAPTPQYWVASSDIPLQPLSWHLGFKDVTAPTNARTMIAAVVPAYAFGNTLPLFVPEDDVSAERYKVVAPLLLANLSSFALDYVARQKVQGQHLNLYIVEQLAVVPAERFEDALGDTSVGRLVTDHVLRLTYTSDDLAGFARDLGYQGAPFLWDDEERRHLVARLDALFFRLYGFDRDDAAYVLEQFPVVRSADEAAFGRYRTRDLILAYMSALAAGDTTTVVSL